MGLYSIWYFLNDLSFSFS